MLLSNYYGVAMKTLLTTWFRNQLAKHETNKDVQINQPNGQSIWRDTGKIYYVLDTLKISYLAKKGQITFENLSADTAHSLINDIYNPGNAQLAPKITTNTQSCIHISVCGITWQENDAQLRVKAIPDAATLRTHDKKFIQSQALFQHASVSIDDGTTPIGDPHNRKGVFKYTGVNLKQFIAQLMLANAMLPDSLQKKPPICRNNFKKVYSEYELSVLSKLSALENTLDSHPPSDLQTCENSKEYKTQL